MSHGDEWEKKRLRKRTQSVHIAHQRAAAYASTRLESICSLDIDSRPRTIRVSGIICTIGMFDPIKVSICHMPSDNIDFQLEIFTGQPVEFWM